MRLSILVLPLFVCAPEITAQTVDDFQLDLKTLGGQKLTHGMFEDSVLLVDYWGTWCGPCVRALPELQKLYERYKHYGLEIVGLTYEEGAGTEVEEKVREFVAQRGISYHIAIGTPREKRQVKGFRGYPTMLFFKRGLAFDHAEVGFGPDSAAKIEAWVRGALELEASEEPDPNSDPDPNAEPGQNEAEPPADDSGKPGANTLPAGVIFKPGDGDRGFAFEVEDVDGRKVVFEELRGKPVVLALTSTWDAEAKNTAAILQRLHTEWATPGKAHVLAASLEIKRDRAGKLAAIHLFRDDHELRYPIFPAGLTFQKKIHLFSSMPLFLVFDAEGTLVLRDSGASEKTEKTIEDLLATLQ